MNKKVIKVLNVLIQKILDDEKLWENRDDIVIELEDKGYTIENINQAFDLVFNEIIKVKDKNSYNDSEKPDHYNRIFTNLENFYFNDETKTIIQKLNSLSILTVKQLERIIYRTTELAVFKTLEKDLVWEIIKDVVDDSETMFVISCEISEFENNIFDEYKVN